jgi:hypothetical protein
MATIRDDAFLQEILVSLLRRYGTEQTLAQLHYGLMEYAVGRTDDDINRVAQDVWKVREDYKRRNSNKRAT